MMQIDLLERVLSDLQDLSIIKHDETKQKERQLKYLNARIEATERLIEEQKPAAK